MLWERAAPRDAQGEARSAQPSSCRERGNGRSERVRIFGDYGLIAYDVDGSEPGVSRSARSTTSTGWAPRQLSWTISWCSRAIRAPGRSSSPTTRRPARSGGARRGPRRAAGTRRRSSMPEGGPKQIILPGSFLLNAYTADTGKRLWWVGGLSFELKSVPVIDGDTLYINGFGSGENEPGRRVAVTPSSEVFPGQRQEQRWQAHARRVADQARGRRDAVHRPQRGQRHQHRGVGLLQSRDGLGERHARHHASAAAAT